jgi:tetratricopeptide (TPR) repeat protein
MINRHQIKSCLCLILSFCFFGLPASVQATSYALKKIDNYSKGAHQAKLNIYFDAKPDFEVFENLKHRIYIIKLRNMDLGNIGKMHVFKENSLIRGLEIQDIGNSEYLIKIRTKSTDIKAAIIRRNKNSLKLSIEFTRLFEKIAELAGIEITRVSRELRPSSERITVFSKKPLQYDVTRDKTRPGKLMKVRLLNARLTERLIVPDAETDLIKYIKFEKRGKYLNVVMAPQKYTLKIDASSSKSPISLTFVVSENKQELVSDPDVDLKEEEQKKEEENKEKLDRDKFLTTRFEEAEKFFKLGRFEQAGLMFKNIYNFAPNSEIGVRANFRSADSFYQYQNRTEEKNGELFVIQEYKSAINSALTADLGYDSIPRAYYNIGRNYLNLKFWEDAFNQFEIILRKYPESPYSKNAVFHQGVIHLNMERYEKSIELLERFVEENAKSPGIHAAYYKIGEAQFQLKRYKEAKKNFDKAWSLNAAYMKKDPALMFHMGEAYFENEDYNTARALYEQLIDRYPSESFSNLVAIRIGDFLRAEAKDEDAIKAYKQAINRYPEELYLIGKMRIANIQAEKPGKNQFQEAIKKYNFVIDDKTASDTLKEEAMLRKALTLSLFHQYADAVDNLEQFCRKYPENIYVVNHIIHDRIQDTIKSYIADYYYKGEYLNALGVFEQYENKYYKRPHYSTCFKLKPDENPKNVAQRLIKKAPLFLIADSYYRLRLYPKALEQYELILQDANDPLSSVVLFNKGKIYDSLEQPERAQSIFLKFINQYPEHVYTPQVKKTLGDSYFKVHKADRISRAIRIYQQTIRDYQDSENILEREIIPSCWFALGKLYFGIGQYDDSIEAYKNVLNSYEHPLQSKFVDETVVETYFLLGDLYKELNQLPEAMETYGEAVRLFPESDRTPWAKYYQGEIYVKNEKKDQALKIFDELKKAAEKNPDALWGPMANEMHKRILNDLQFDKYLSHNPTVTAAE